MVDVPTKTPTITSNIAWDERRTYVLRAGLDGPVLRWRSRDIWGVFIEKFHPDRRSFDMASRDRDRGVRGMIVRIAG